VPLTTEKQRRHTWRTRRPNPAVYRRRRRISLFVLVLLAALVLGGLGAYLSASSPEEETDTDSSEQVVASVVEEEQQQPPPPEEEVAKKEDKRASPIPNDPTLYLTVPRLGIYRHTVRNDRSEAAMDLGAIKLPDTSFPWQKGDTNTYIACHRLGWPGTESYNQCLNLPFMRKGDEVTLTDANGAVYRYRVSEMLIVGPNDGWVTKAVPGRHVVSLQTCIEAPGDFSTLGPNWAARFIARADQIA
jgi:sortase A